MKITLISLILFIVVSFGFGQSFSSPSKKIKISGVNFIDYKINTTIPEESRFSLTRNYIKFRANINKQFSTVVVFDIISSSQEETRFDFFLEYAYLKYKSPYASYFPLFPFWQFNFGLIPNSFSKPAEILWKYRFIDDVLSRKGVYAALDREEPNAKVIASDLGIDFHITVIKNINISLIYLNGEDRLEKDSPNTRLVGGTVQYKYLAYRIFFGIEQVFNQEPSLYDLTIVTGVLGFQTSLFRVGLETLFFHNVDYIEGNNALGVSAHANLNWKELLKFKFWEINTYTRLDWHNPMNNTGSEITSEDNVVSEAYDFYLGVVIPPVKFWDLSMSYIRKTKNNTKNNRVEEDIVQFNSKFVF